MAASPPPRSPEGRSLPSQLTVIRSMPYWVVQQFQLLENHMPIPASIAHAAEDYRFNNNFVLNTVKDLAPEEWLKRPNDCSNHIAWILGHLLWTRKRILARL